MSFSGLLGLEIGPLQGRQAPSPHLEAATAQGCWMLLSSSQPGSSPTCVWKEERQGAGHGFRKGSWSPREASCVCRDSDNVLPCWTQEEGPLCHLSAWSPFSLLLLLFCKVGDTLTPLKGNRKVRLICPCLIRRREIEEGNKEGRWEREEVGVREWERWEENEMKETQERQRDLEGWRIITEASLSVPLQGQP